MDKGKWEKSRRIVPRNSSLFMENNPDAISIVDLEGKTLQVNALKSFSDGRMMSSLACHFQLFLISRRSQSMNCMTKLRLEVQKKGFETVRLRKDGQLIDVSISCSISAIMKMSRALWFSFIGILLIKNLLKRALKESEQRYRSLVEVSPEAIFVHRNGIIEYMNPMGAKMLGMDSVEDIIGKSVFQFVHLESWKVYKKESKS